VISSNVFFIVKTCSVYGAIAFSFSMLGLILPDAFVVGNPLQVSGVSFEHIFGHIMWGLTTGIASFSFRYAIIPGLFPIILDFDHWLQFLGIEMIPRMAHSITFGIIAVAIMMLIFDKKDLSKCNCYRCSIFSYVI
jgi:hypothetical protein